MYQVLEKRFNEHPHRHPTISFKQYIDYLASDGEAQKVIFQMEESGGEPDLFELDGVFYVIDASKESPPRRQCCYDQEARLKRKKAAPLTSAEEEAEKIGSTLLDEELYRALQRVEAFDLKTSSWLKTPEEVRGLGGAIFGDRRYDRVFIYHNGADSYYSSRGFRTYLLLKGLTHE